ncbi:uncharacterized protein LOC126910137 [Daktulosphaira vitifoliae]|uniref:uncharacterized protein LOC126910137 n=1 Tax=Daktulosphaira vitifoliae TaxID=58002 RepID=UPI0021A9E281|nr:uncharacterized protein LOC126910137 [Daktulosphaira vitifoliae]
MDLHEDTNKLCTSHIITEDDRQNNCTPELKVAGIEVLLAVKQENGGDRISVESMDLHEDANKLCTSHIITENDRQNNRTPEQEVTAIEEAVFMETCKHEEGVICYFRKNNEVGELFQKIDNVINFIRKILFALINIINLHKK